MILLPTVKTSKIFQKKSGEIILPVNRGSGKSGPGKSGSDSGEADNIGLDRVIHITLCHLDNTQIIQMVIQSDPDLVPPDLVTPRFSDMINFPRYRKLTVFDPDLVPTPI
eukprot:sb/3477248/